MHLCYILSEILLILPTIDFDVAAPVLIQEKSQAGVDVVHLYEDVMTMLGKRADELDELLYELFGDPESHLLAKPEESSATRPSSSSQPSGLADGPMDVEQPLPSIPEEPSSQVSSPDRAPLRPGDGLMKMWLNTIGHPESHSFAKAGGVVSRTSVIDLTAVRGC